MTGASRGIGAATAVKLAAMGSDVVVNYRSNEARAEEVSQDIVKLGRRAVPIKADLTVHPEVESMMSRIEDIFGRLDVVVLNASGGLEKGKTEEYATAVNHTAQLHTARLAANLMTGGGRIVFVTSHWAHFYGRKPVFSDYEAVARTKHAGEQALREYASELHGMGITLVVVSGDVIEGTITPRLLERKNPGLMAYRHDGSQKLPTIDDFAEAIAQAATDRSVQNGHTVFVGSIDY